MSEYWVSHKKYFCKYCNIYIADDVPSRRQHESGLRHKGNVERFVRGLYKAGERRKQDLEEEKREMARVEQVRFIGHLLISCLSLPIQCVHVGSTGRLRSRCRCRSGQTWKQQRTSSLELIHTFQACPKTIKPLCKLFYCRVTRICRPRCRAPEG